MSKRTRAGSRTTIQQVRRVAREALLRRDEACGTTACACNTSCAAARRSAASAASCDRRIDARPATVAARRPTPKCSKASSRRRPPATTRRRRRCRTFAARAARRPWSSACPTATSGCARAARAAGEASCGENALKFGSSKLTQGHRRRVSRAGADRAAAERRLAVPGLEPAEKRIHVTDCARKRKHTPS